MAMAVDTVVVNFGSPRSGTTFMEKCLLSLRGVLTVKLPEGRLLHPCQSVDGLVDMCHWFQHRKLILIRTIRHPLEIAESLVALRTQSPHHGALWKKTDDWVVRIISAESERVLEQRPKLLALPYGRFIEVHYEDLADPERVDAFVTDVVHSLPDMELNRVNLTRALGTFGKIPVRNGRLARGLDRAMEPEQREWFRRQLTGVIKREGYADAD